ncbi:hypothetical protein [Haloplanus salilacus]|uniref:hypothetical protein n=1 Tax=Haloplanus salilacus TaxID=2949994 RepID=UPI0030D42E23
MYRRKPTADLGSRTVAAVTSIVLTILAVVTGSVRRARDRMVRAGPGTATPSASPSRPPAVTTTGLGGASA